MKSVRVVIDAHVDGPWELRTSDLPELRDALGEDLLTTFCTCFIHADRVVSLVGMYHASRRRWRSKSPGEKRNLLTFAVFLVGTLKELAENLKGLRASLVLRGVFSTDRWSPGLGRWERWGTSGAAATARKKLSFHVDRDLVKRGLRSIAATRGRRVLIHGNTRLLRDSAFILGQDAGMRGLELTLGTLNVLQDPADFMGVTEALESEFLTVLELLNMKPVKVLSTGRRATHGA